MKDTPSALNEIEQSKTSSMKKVLKFKQIDSPTVSPSTFLQMKLLPEDEKSYVTSSMNTSIDSYGSELHKKYK